MLSYKLENVLMSKFEIHGHSFIILSLIAKQSCQSSLQNLIVWLQKKLFNKYINYCTDIVQLRRPRSNLDFIEGMTRVRTQYFLVQIEIAVTYHF